jgi:hypothetical protein
MIIGLNGICLWGNQAYKNRRGMEDVIGSRVIQDYLERQPQDHLVTQFTLNAFAVKPKFLDYVAPSGISYFGERVDYLEGQPCGYLIFVKPALQRNAISEYLKKIQESSTTLKDLQGFTPTMFVDLNCFTLWMSDSWIDLFLSRESDLGTNNFAGRIQNFSDFDVLHISMKSRVQDFIISTVEHHFCFKLFEIDKDPCGYFIFAFAAKRTKSPDE